MTSILVTGGTGTLGSDLVPLLRQRGAHTYVFSRRTADDKQIRRGDLDSGAGLSDALHGIDTVVHLAAGGNQLRETQNLVDACATAGIGHLVFISIPGIEEIPFAYYKAKLSAERTVTAGAVPWSVLRATQFHQFAFGLFAAQRFSPVLFAPRLRVQPIDTRVVAQHLADLAFAQPQGRVADIGGPEVLTGAEIATLYRDATRSRRPIVPLSLPGATWAGYAAGHHLVPNNPAGGRTFSEWLAGR